MSSPAFGSRVFSRVEAGIQHGAMTISETVNKTYILLGLLVIAAGYTWSLGDSDTAQLFLVVSLIAGIVLAIATIIKPAWAPVTAPLYAIAEGLLLGVISRMYEVGYPGLVIQAVLLTLATLGIMLFLYASRAIRVTQKLRMGIIAATGAVALVYVVSFVLALFGVSVPYIHEGGLVGIGFSLVVVTIAAFNFLLDFDFIEKGAQQGLPRYMEWYAAFGLTVTLVWLYIEMLRLLAKLRER